MSFVVTVGIIITNMAPNINKVIQKLYSTN